jgi:hypothetical protein
MHPEDPEALKSRKEITGMVGRYCMMMGLIFHE